jgi:hypothetical protein
MDDRKRSEARRRARRAKTRSPTRPSRLGSKKRSSWLKSTGQAAWMTWVVRSRRVVYSVLISPNWSPARSGVVKKVTRSEGKSQGNPRWRLRARCRAPESGAQLRQ